MTQTAFNRIVFNALTGEETIIPFTDEEIAQYELDQKEIEAQAILKQNEEIAKAAAKAALLEKLGISEDEARLLLS